MKSLIALVGSVFAALAVGSDAQVESSWQPTIQSARTTPFHLHYGIYRRGTAQNLYPRLT